VAAINQLRVIYATAGLIKKVIVLAVFANKDRIIMVFIRLPR